MFDPESGTPLAVMEATTITTMRTAAATAVAVRALARRGARVVAILGAGAQGHAHLEAFARLGDFDEIRIASRNEFRRTELAGRHAQAVPSRTFADAVRGADIVCCCTDAREPVLQRDWLVPCAHVSSVGSGRKLDAATVEAAKVFVEWRGAVLNPPPSGAVELQGLDPDTVTEIGEVLAGTRPARASDDEITVYKSTGHAVEDAATAAIVYRHALAARHGNKGRLLTHAREPHR